MATVLLTGFDTWHEVEYNSSWEALVDAPLSLSKDWEVKLQQLPVSWERAPRRLEEALTGDEKAIICFGMGKGEKILLERIAKNVVDASRMDCDGVVHNRSLISGSGPAAYRARLPIERIQHGLSAHGIPCEVSDNAGTYLCNYLFYRLLNRIAEKRQRITAGFVHVPPYPCDGGMEKKQSSRAIALLVDEVVRHTE